MTRIIFISGLGDHTHWFYGLVARRWTSRKSSAHGYIFDWDDLSSDFDTKFAKLLAFIDQFPDDKICLVGISAGGTAAVNALAARPRITKVAMVSSPFQLWRYKHKMLLESIAHTEESLTALGHQVDAKLLTITDWRDQIVPTKLSLLPGVRQRHVLGFNHVSSIVAATLIQTGPLRRFLMRE